MNYNKSIPVHDFTVPIDGLFHYGRNDSSHKDQSKRSWHLPKGFLQSLLISILFILVFVGFYFNITLTFSIIIIVAIIGGIIEGQAKKRKSEFENKKRNFNPNYVASHFEFWNFQNRYEQFCHESIVNTESGRGKVVGYNSVNKTFAIQLFANPQSVIELDYSKVFEIPINFEILSYWFRTLKNVKGDEDVIGQLFFSANLSDQISISMYSPDTKKFFLTVQIEEHGWRVDMKNYWYCLENAFRLIFTMKSREVRTKTEVRFLVQHVHEIQNVTKIFGAEMFDLGFIEQYELYKKSIFGTNQESLLRLQGRGRMVH